MAHERWFAEPRVVKVGAPRIRQLSVSSIILSNWFKIFMMASSFAGQLSGGQVCKQVKKDHKLERLLAKQSRRTYRLVSAKCRPPKIRLLRLIKRRLPTKDSSPFCVILLISASLSTSGQISNCSAAYCILEQADCACLSIVFVILTIFISDDKVMSPNAKKSG